DLCAIFIDFIISELCTTNFLAYQVFAEGQDYGIHGERVRNACWGYLCQSGAMELKEALLVQIGCTSGLNDLELKLTVSEYERQQLIEEAASLKDKMHKTLNLENEVSFKKLQAEKISFPKEMSEYVNCKNEISALEEKLMRLESDLTRSNDEDIKNEIRMIKSENLKH
ncbi:hypothetical protein Tco_1421326, partial [Tanacetum coccineum]